MKIWKKGLAVLLILVLVVSLCACGKSEEEKLVGTWKGEFDMTDYVSNMLGESMGADLEIDEKLVMPIILTLNKDKTCSLAVDEEGYVESFKSYLNGAVNAMLNYMCDLAGMTREDLDAQIQEETGMDPADYLKEELFGAVSDEDILGDFDEAYSTGTYSVKDGKLVIVDENGETDEPTYTLDGDSLTLDLSYVEIEEGLTVGVLTFTR